jgi:hypothetical protein
MPALSITARSSCCGRFFVRVLSLRARRGNKILTVHSIRSAGPVASLRKAVAVLESPRHDFASLSWPTLRFDLAHLYITISLTCRCIDGGPMDRRRKVELFEEIRREYRYGVGTIQGVAKKLKTHRRMVRQALASAIPPERKTAGRSSPRLGPVREFIDGILRSDREAPHKQRHTAHRIWEWIRREHPDPLVAEATVRRYVQRRKEELGLAARETFVPQSYDWGGEG